MNRELYLKSPAADFLGAFPLGNGRLGAMLRGDVEQETIALNHECLWRGVTKLGSHKVTPEQLAEIRKAFFEDRHTEGRALCDRYFGAPEQFTDKLDKIQPYQPFADLILSFQHKGEVENYERRLALSEALASVAYRVGEVEFKREVFVSAPHQVVVLRVKASKGKALALDLHLSRVEDPECETRSWAEGESFGFSGRFTEGIKFAAEARILSHDGELSSRQETLSLRNASEMVLALTMAVDLACPHPFSEPDAEKVCRERLDSLPHDYKKLHDAHIAEYRPLFERFSLRLGGDAALARLPLDERKRRLEAGCSDPDLFALYNDFGRYLLLSSSRKCAYPANLQGIWNDEIRPPWLCYFSTDINIEMNYWPAEAWGLPECVDPLLSLFERDAAKARKSAMDYYGCRGFHHFTGDIWQMHSMCSREWGMWTGTSPMIALHFWWRYEYSQDLALLRERVYPFLKEVALFYEDYLIPSPQGWLVGCPTHSPENSFVDDRKNPCGPSYCYGATMDTELAIEVLEHAIAASELLGIDESQREIWRKILAKLPPFRKGRHGQLLEWIEDYEEKEPGHRHFSHLYSVYPGDALRPDLRSEAFDAARNSLHRRLQFGAGKQGWSRAWAACLLTRFQEPEAAYESLKELLTTCSTETLLDLHPWGGQRHPPLAGKRAPVCFQIDGNFGGPAALLELLAQSHGGVIRLLPGLPESWPEGELKGMRLRGGLSLAMKWRAGKLQEASLTGKPGTSIKMELPSSKGAIATLRIPSDGKLVIA